MSPGMAEKSKKEKKFAQDIDRIAAGKETEIDEAMDDDYHANTNFSKKIVECRGEPSASFQERLKKRLLATLAEKEAVAARRRPENGSFLDWLRNLVPQSPAWRAAAVTVTVAMLALVVGWGIGLFSPGHGPIVTTLPPTVAVETRVSTTKTAYLASEKIDIQFSFKNITKGTVSFPFPPEIRIENTTAEARRTFDAGKAMKALASGASAQYSLSWDQKDNAGKQVPPGNYQVVMTNIPLGEGKGVVSLIESPTLTIWVNP